MYIEKHHVDIFLLNLANSIREAHHKSILFSVGHHPPKYFILYGFTKSRSGHLESSMSFFQKGGFVGDAILGGIVPKQSASSSSYSVGERVPVFNVKVINLMKTKVI
jgi:hypothetical protein